MLEPRLHSGHEARLGFTGLRFFVPHTVIYLDRGQTFLTIETLGDPATIYKELNEQEIECLQKINIKMQGKTEKLSNPYNVNKLKGAVWVIVRLGGWKGYASQRKAGATTLIKGLQKFYDYYEGFSLQRDVGTR